MPMALWRGSTSLSRAVVVKKRESFEKTGPHPSWGDLAFRLLVDRDALIVRSGLCAWTIYRSRLRNTRT